MLRVFCVQTGLVPQPLQCSDDHSATAFSYNCSSEEGVSSAQCLLDGLPYSDCMLIVLHISKTFLRSLHHYIMMFLHIRPAIQYPATLGVPCWIAHSGTACHHLRRKHSKHILHLLYSSRCVQLPEIGSLLDDNN